MLVICNRHQQTVSFGNQTQDVLRTQIPQHDSATLDFNAHPE